MKTMPKKEKAPEAPKTDAEHAHDANAPHNHGPAGKPAFGMNKFGGGKPPRPPAPKMIKRGANRGR
jgi:hypothetical protein